MINLKTFDLRDVWTLQSGEMAVRPGLRELFSTTTDNVFPLECFSVKNVFSDGIRHYVLADNETQGYISLIVYDEEFVIQDELKLLDSGTYVSRMDYALVNGEMIISGPELPTIWGYNGSGITLAVKQPSINPGLTEIDIPNGLCTDWAGRSVIAKGEALFVSDPLAPRTYTADGIIPMPGHIYGLHTTEAGALVVVTTNGTYGLNPDAAAQGQGIVNVMQQLSDYSADDYNQTTTDGNAVWGLTRRGVLPVNASGAKELALSDGVQDRVWSEMIDYPDYRSGCIYSTSHGILVTIGSLTDYPTLGPGMENPEKSGGFWIVDGDRGIKTWWTSIAYQLFAGTLFEREGDDLFVFQRRLPAFNLGVPFPAETRTCFSKPYGNDVEKIIFPPAAGVPDKEVEVSSVTVGRVIYEPQASPTVRYLHTVSDNTGFDIHAAVEGNKAPSGAKSIRTLSTMPLFDDPNTLLATSQKMFKMPVMTGLRFGFAQRTRDVVPEVEFIGSRSRIGLLDVELKGIGKDRP